MCMFKLLQMMQVSLKVVCIVKVLMALQVVKL